MILSFNKSNSGFCPILYQKHFIKISIIIHNRKIPNLTDLGSPAKENAQHFFCINLNFGEANPLFEILYFIHPKFYSPKPDFRGNKWLEKIFNDKKFTVAALRNRKELTFSGNSFSAFYKTRNSDETVWYGLGNLYGTFEFDIQTWLSGKVETIIFDNKHPYYTVLSTELAAIGNRDKQEWNFGEDHSKMAISRNPGLPVLCFGDLNYVLTEKMRGGAFYCFSNPGLYTAYRNTFTLDAHRENGEAVFSYRILFKKETDYSS